MKRHSFALAALFAVAIAALSIGITARADNLANGPPGISHQIDLVESFDDTVAFIGIGVQDAAIATTTMQSDLATVPYAQNGTYLGTGTHVAAFPTPNHRTSEVETPVICHMMAEYALTSNFYGSDDFENLDDGAQNVQDMIAAINDDAVAAGHVVLAPAEHALQNDLYEANIAGTAESTVPEVAYHVICPTNGNTVVIPIVQNYGYSGNVGATRSPPATAWNPMTFDVKMNGATGPPRMSRAIAAIGSPTVAHSVRFLDQVNLGDIQLRV